ncbi:hypothetical protein ACJX0J_033368, partial [Zea mays]
FSIILNDDARLMNVRAHFERFFIHLQAYLAVYTICAYSIDLFKTYLKLDFKKPDLLQCFYNILFFDTNFVQELLRVIGLQEERRGECPCLVIAGLPACANFMFLLFRFGLASVLIVILDVYIIIKFHI